ncbi:Hypothetical predicted protein [Marmota monax]|uniref:Uncharacterized protein n=1 Tax=Marmota monax TaxID=9995 RepID=A0A5E4C570_MARMO|nr:Hypothetical predicted protein [Marmota monax]
MSVERRGPDERRAVMRTRKGPAHNTWTDTHKTKGRRTDTGQMTNSKKTLEKRQTAEQTQNKQQSLRSHRETSNGAEITFCLAPRQMRPHREASSGSETTSRPAPRQMRPPREASNGPQIQTDEVSQGDSDNISSCPGEGVSDCVQSDLFPQRRVGSPELTAGRRLFRAS